MHKLHCFSDYSQIPIWKCWIFQKKKKKSTIELTFPWQAYFGPWLPNWREVGPSFPYHPTSHPLAYADITCSEFCGTYHAILRVKPKMQTILPSDTWVVGSVDIGGVLSHSSPGKTVGNVACCRRLLPPRRRPLLPRRRCWEFWDASWCPSSLCSGEIKWNNSNFNKQSKRHTTFKLSYRVITISSYIWFKEYYLSWIRHYF